MSQSNRIGIEVKSFKFVATWTLDTKNGNRYCDLCKRKLLAPTNDELNHKHIQTEIVRGACKHAFHSSCLKGWTNNGNSVCPSCQTPWKTDAHLDTKVVAKKIIDQGAPVLAK